MKILIIGGMHGNEPLGIRFIKYINKFPIKNIDTVLANEKAVIKNVRFVKRDLNRSFPGKINSKLYEFRRAKELISVTRNYDLVLDFHNTHCQNNDCTFVGQDCKDFLFDISSYLKLRRTIIADYDCINKYAKNCISIEISLSSKKNSVIYWYKKIKKLSQIKILPKSNNLQKYKFVYRITLKDKDMYLLDKKNLKAFKPLSKYLCKAFKVNCPAYPIFIGDGYTPYNYGGILYKV